uniref:Dachshund c n=1 Tax=Oryzias melastigma TaxID=30732 RepID=A0A3B3DB20_ORYME
MATPATPTLLPAAPLGHHPAPSSVSPATNSPPPAATSAASSPAPPVLLHHQFRADLLLHNGKSGGGVAPASGSAKPVYATASPVESTPQNNECKLVEVKGAKLASFTVKDRELICLPQAFDVFLKHLVGGLHTVYTKLKRLDITPVVCNVEQVRVLRGLGAIQPGVNRCKLISRQDFETLYNDCTNASSRPGRPPKRLQCATEGGTHHMLPHSGLMHAGIMPPAGDHPHPVVLLHASTTGERVQGSPSPAPSLEEAQMSSNHSSSSSSPSHTERTAESTHSLHDVLSSSHSMLGHPPGLMQAPKETDVTSTTRESCDRQVDQKPPSGKESCERVSYPAGQKLSAGLHHTPFIFPEGLSSIETLLTNIQGLLRVAIENARAQEKQDQLERTELKMELVRERELRETLERQLSMEQKNRVLIQKRLKKEKRSKRRLQEALEEEVKLRDQAEHSLLHTANTHLGTETEATVQGRAVQVTNASPSCADSLTFRRTKTFCIYSWKSSEDFV